MLALGGCQSRQVQRGYTIHLSEAHSTDGEQRQVQIQEKLWNGKSWYSHENLYVEFLIHMDDTVIQLLARNKTDQEIAFLWSHAVFLDPDEVARPVFHSGSVFDDPFDHERPSVVPPGKIISERLLPAQVVSIHGGGAAFHPTETLSPLQAPVFQVEPPSDFFVSPTGKPFFDDISRPGEVFEIQLPILISGKVRTYVFKFLIVAVQ